MYFSITFSKFSFLYEGLSTISGISVDWITENIYFTDEDYNRIGICNNDGTNCTVLIDGINKPTGIALLPIRG